MAIVVAAWNGALLRFPSSPSLPPPTNPSFPKWRRKKKQGPLRGSFCFSLKPNQRREAEAEAEELGGTDGLADAFLSSARDDSNYLWKLAAGSVGGASAIKYAKDLRRLHPLITTNGRGTEDECQVNERGKEDH